MSILGSRPESGILRTRSQWNVRSSAALYAVTKWSCVESKPASLAAPDSSESAPLAPVECHRACAPPDEELLVDSCFDRGDGEAGARYEKVDEPVRLDAGEVGER